MKKILLLLLLLSTPSIAADNAVVLTPGAGVTMRCKDVGSGVQSCLTILGDTNGNPIILNGALPVVISPATLATSANQAIEIASLATIASNTGAPIPGGGATIGTVGQLAYPIGAVPITATSTGTTAAVTASLAATTSITNYICGYSARGNATAALTGNLTLAGISPATMNFTFWVAPAASGLGVSEQIFTPCLQASATNTAITVVTPAAITGGTMSLALWGYRL